MRDDMTKTMAVAGIASAILASVVRDKGFVEAQSMIPDAVALARELISEASNSLRAKPLVVPGERARSSAEARVIAETISWPPPMSTTTSAMTLPSFTDLTLPWN